MCTTAFPPKGTTDCHTHVAGHQCRYPMVSPRAYTPYEASPSMVRSMMSRAGIERIVLVQMSVFGTDNSCMLDAMRALGDCSRGVVQLPAEFSSVELDRLHAAGVRGIRVNLHSTGMNRPDLARECLKAAASHCIRNGWHLQLFTTPNVIAALADVLRALPVPVVFDHFALLSPTERGTEAEMLVLELMEKGRGWVKISGTYRLSPSDQPELTAALARDLGTANLDQIVWGSDWPHSPHHSGTVQPNPAALPYRKLDPAELMDMVRKWFDGPREWQQILVDNPARLYEF